jgi:hypothetical protein
MNACCVWLGSLVGSQGILEDRKHWRRLETGLLSSVGTFRELTTWLLYSGCRWEVWDSQEGKGSR